MEHRFGSSDNICPLISLVPAAVLKIDKADWTKNLQSAADKYADDMPLPVGLKTELILWRAHCHREAATLGNVESISDTIKMVKELDLPNIMALLEVAAVLPVTRCEAERSFSRLKHLKSALRSTLGEQRLNSLANILIHPDQQIDVEMVVKRFMERR